MLARNVFIETTDGQSTTEFLRTCSQITQGLNVTSGLSAMDNLLFMEFLTSNAGHQIMVQAQLKVRITDSALFIGNDKDLSENMFNFLQQKLNTNMIIIISTSLSMPTKNTLQKGFRLLYTYMALVSKFDTIL